MTTSLIRRVASALLLAAVATSAVAQDNAADVARLVDALGAHAGSVVADIGAIIEFAPDGPEATSAGDRSGGKTHGVAANTIATELQQAGFELITSEQQDRSVFVAARKPVRE